LAATLPDEIRKKTSSFYAEKEARRLLLPALC
jgi:hypothetical protein